MIVKWKMDIGIANFQREGELELDDDISDKGIEILVREEVLQYVEWTWSKTMDDRGGVE